MPKHRLEFDRLTLESIVQERTNNPQAMVRVRGPHLYVEIHDNAGTGQVIARATEIRTNLYTASFRSHNGRWDPLPLEGTVREVAEGMVHLLGPFLHPYNLG